MDARIMQVLFERLRHVIGCGQVSGLSARQERRRWPDLTQINSTSFSLLKPRFIFRSRSNRSEILTLPTRRVPRRSQLLTYAPVRSSFVNLHRNLQPKVLRRSVKSAQYVGIRYTERLAEAGIEPSVGSVGDSYTNALAETINCLYKAEVVHRRGPWRNFEAVEIATLTWVDWFNNRRLLEPTGNIPPAEAEERHYAMLDKQKLAA